MQPKKHKRRRRPVTSRQADDKRLAPKPPACATPNERQLFELHRADWQYHHDQRIEQCELEIG